MSTSAPHVAVGIALALGELSALGAAISLKTRRRVALPSDDSAKRLRAQGMVYLGLWELLAFAPWLADAGSGVVLATAVVGMAPLVLALALFKRSSGKTGGKERP